jgi:hypothetical protein
MVSDISRQRARDSSSRLTLYHIVRNIRNVFAHAMVDIKFATPEISEACNMLNLDKHLVQFSKGEHEMRYRFCYACDNVFRGLLNWAIMPRTLGISPVPAKPVQPVLPSVDSSIKAISLNHDWCLVEKTVRTSLVSLTLSKIVFCRTVH